MGKRRKSREVAMQYLYQAVIAGELGAQPPEDFWEHQDLEEDVKAFSSQILAQALANREKIDALIQKVALHWSLDRIAAVDLAILRSAVAEMLFIPSTPAVVVIDEAVEIAKQFSTADSGAFVNGILDKIRQEHSLPGHTHKT